MKPKVLFITPRMPLPFLSGGENWIHSLSKKLSGRADLYLFSFLEPAFEAYQLAGSVSLEKIFKKIHYRRKGANRPPASMPQSPGTFYSPEAAAEINRIIESEKIDIIHIFFQDLLFYSAEIKKRRPLVYTEIDSSWLSPFRSYMKENAGFRGLKNVRETIKYKRYAAEFLGRFSGATYLSKDDFADIRKYLSTGDCVYTPNALELENYRFKSGYAREKNVIFFIGNYLHYPNADAALTLVREVYPAVRRKIAGSRLVLSGAFPPPELLKAAGEGVEITDYVKDHLDGFARYSIMAAPIRYGKGIKTKVLEAFATGLPVAGYPETFCGLGTGTSGRQALKARGPAGLAERIIEAFEGKHDLWGMAKEARKIAAGHDMEKVAGDTLALYRRLCA